MQPLFSVAPERESLLLRFDALELLKMEETPQGYLAGFARAARIGVQAYTQADGTIVNEFRPPEEVFAADAQLSFRNLPVTNEHPTVPVSSANAKELSVGHVGEAIRVDGSWLILPITVMDADVIKQINAGKNQLSCGYDLEIDETPGTYAGESYDRIQRKIRGNHVAIVADARAGNQARLNLDSADAVAVYTSQEDDIAMPKPGQVTRKDGNEEPVKDNEEPEAKPNKDAEGMEKLQKDNESLKAKLADMKEKYDELKGKMDEATEKKDEEEEKKDRSDDVSKRVALVVAATKAGVRDDAADLAKLDERSLMIKVLTTDGTDPKRFDGESDTYVKARYDVRMEDAKRRNDNLKSNLDNLSPAGTREDGNGQAIDINKLRKDHEDHLRNAHLITKAGA